MTPRRRIARLMGEAAELILRRAMRDKRLCCAEGPLCENCDDAFQEMKTKIAAQVEHLSDEEIKIISAQDDAWIVRSTREMIEPDFRRGIAADLPS